MPASINAAGFNVMVVAKAIDIFINFKKAFNKLEVNWSQNIIKKLIGVIFVVHQSYLLTQKSLKENILMEFHEFVEKVQTARIFCDLVNTADFTFTLSQENVVIICDQMIYDNNFFFKVIGDFIEEELLEVVIVDGELTCSVTGKGEEIFEAMAA